jgi:hypothetical protein
MCAFGTTSHTFDHGGNVSERPLRLMCFTALLVAVAGLLAGAILGVAGATNLSPGTRIALTIASWAGSLVPQGAFAWSQVNPAARRLLPLWETRQEDGWMLALVVSMSCSLVAVAAAGSNAPRAFIAVTFMATSVAFTFVRARQLRRHHSASE